MSCLNPKFIAQLIEGAPLDSVTKLDASNRELQSILNLDACPSLARLDVSKNKLSSLEGVSLSTKLRWLSAANNDITSIEPLRDLESLEVLNVGRNQLSGKVAVGRLRSLKALILNDNHISLVGGLEKLKELNTLVLSHNAITSLGNWLAGASKLDKLSASHNRIAELGASLKGCSALEELRLSHNQLRLLPLELAANRKLRILDVGNNPITSLADIQVLAKLPSLRSLSLRGCPLAEQPGYRDAVLALTPHLEILDNQRVVGKPAKPHKRKTETGLDEVDHRADAGARDREGQGQVAAKITMRVDRQQQEPRQEGPAAAELGLTGAQERSTAQQEQHRGVVGAGGSAAKQGAAKRKQAGAGAAADRGRKGEVASPALGPKAGVKEAGNGRKKARTGAASHLKGEDAPLIMQQQQQQRQQEQHGQADVAARGGKTKHGKHKEVKAAGIAAGGQAEAVDPLGDPQLVQEAGQEGKKRKAKHRQEAEHDKESRPKQHEQQRQQQQQQQQQQQAAKPGPEMLAAVNPESDADDDVFFGTAGPQRAQQAAGKEPKSALGAKDTGKPVLGEEVLEASVCRGGVHYGVSLLRVVEVKRPSSKPGKKEKKKAAAASMGSGSGGGAVTGLQAVKALLLGPAGGGGASVGQGSGGAGLGVGSWD
ncbi:hypothetical protein N2152v2_011001 [Parachlorella kessleri]